MENCWRAIGPEPERSAKTRERERELGELEEKRNSLEKRTQIGWRSVRRRRRSEEHLVLDLFSFVAKKKKRRYLVARLQSERWNLPTE